MRTEWWEKTQQGKKKKRNKGGQYKAVAILYPSDTHHEQTHCGFRDELDSHDWTSFWLMRKQECCQFPGALSSLPSSSFVLFRMQAHLCPDEATPPSTVVPLVPSLGQSCRQPLVSDCEATVSGESLWLQSLCAIPQTEQKQSSLFLLLWSMSRADPPTPPFTFKTLPTDPTPTSPKPLWLGCLC